MTRILFNALLIITMTLTSCSDELELKNEVAVQEKKDFSIVSQNATTELNPCTYNIKNIKANEIISISCLINLEGIQINLPPGVEFHYDGGDIINGSLKFNGGKIDGRLLNKSLQVKGNTELLNPVFDFSPSRWDITQGTVSYREALHNRHRLEELMEMIKNLSGHTFTIDKFDAYFEVTEITSKTNPNFYPWIEGIQVPSNFTLEMSENTNLRVFPNNQKKYTLISVYKKNNIRIIGGNLFGDRDQHDYSSGSTHEWGHVIQLKSASNFVVEGTTIKDGTGDGLKVESTGFTFQPDYDPSHNIKINECIFDSNRRNNLAITDGYNIIVENSQFYRAGIDTQNSKGTNPKASIDVEAYRKRVNGEVVLYEKVDGVIIRNNYQRQSAHTGFLVAIGNNVTIENNDIENGISYRYAQGTIIRNNKLTSYKKHSGLAIQGGDADSELNRNNKIYGNEIHNYDTGIRVNGKDHLVQSNIIRNCKTGITGTKFSETKILNNKVVSEDPSSRGIFIHYTSMNRVLIKDNLFDTPNNPFKFDLINLGKDEKDFCAHVVDNEFRSSRQALMNKSRGVSLMNNKIDTSLEIFDSENFVIEDNQINTTKDGIYFRKENFNVSLANNAIKVPEYRECIRIQSTTNSSEINIKTNTCL